MKTPSTTVSTFLTPPSLLLLIIFHFFLQKEESYGLTQGAVQQREKEIKMSQIGLLIVAGKDPSPRVSFSKGQGDGPHPNPPHHQKKKN